MKSPKTSRRHPLLFYRLTMDRIWKKTLSIGLLLLLLWAWFYWKKSVLISPNNNIWLLGASVAVLAFTALVILARYAAYVRAFHDHLRLVTPFLQLRISYRRVRSIRPVDLQQIFPYRQTRGAQRSLLSAFYGSTAILVDLQGYPLSPACLRLFLNPLMFSPQSTGFVVLVPDWMAFSTELDTLLGLWAQSQAPRRMTPSGVR